VGEITDIYGQVKSIITVAKSRMKGINGFEQVLNLIESAGVGLLNELSKHFS
jgi:hypothetical protein